MKYNFLKLVKEIKRVCIQNVCPKHRNIARDVWIVIIALSVIIMIYAIPENIRNIRRSSSKSYSLAKSSSQQKSPLQYSELSYEKRKEIYIDFAEDPSFDSLTPYSEKMYDYRMEKYTNRYNISKNAMARIMLEGIQKGW